MLQFILMMMSITQLFAKLLERTIEKKSLITIIIIAAAAIFIRFLCVIGSSHIIKIFAIREHH